METYTETTVVPYENQPDELWARFEIHADCETAIVELGNDKYVARCTEHNVNHLLCKKQ